MDAYEDVTVPAGTFKTYMLSSRKSFGEAEQIWAVPLLGVRTVKVVDSALQPIQPGASKWAFLPHAEHDQTQASV